MKDSLLEDGRAAVEPSGELHPLVGAPEERMDIIKEEGGPGGRTYKRGVWQLSISFFLLFTSFNAVQNLESSLHKGNGTISLAVLYAVFTLTCVVAPSLMNKLGPRCRFILPFLCYTSYIVANLYPVDATLIPGGALVGLGAGILWPSQAVYLTDASFNFATLNKQPVTSSLGAMNGIFWGVMQAGQIAGNVVSSLILGMHSGVGGESPIELLLLVFIACCGVGTLIISALPKVTKLKKEAATTAGAALRGVYNLAFRQKLLLFVPLIVYSGLEQGFMWANFTKEIITPTLGKSKIGYVMAFFGLSDALGSFLIGKVSDYINRALLVFSGLAIQLAVSIYLLHFYTPQQSTLVLCSILASLWGIGDAIMNTQTNAILGELYPDDLESAFALYKMWQSIALAALFFYSPFASFATKIVIIVICGVLAGISYLALYCKYERTSKTDGAK